MTPVARREDEADRWRQVAAACPRSMGRDHATGLCGVVLQITRDDPAMRRAMQHRIDQHMLDLQMARLRDGDLFSAYIVPWFALQRPPGAERIGVRVIAALLLAHEAEDEWATRRTARRRSRGCVHAR